MIKNLLAFALFLAAPAAAQNVSFEDQLEAAGRAAVAPVAADPYLYKCAVRAEIKTASCRPTHAEIASLFAKMRSVPFADVALVGIQDAPAAGACHLLLLAKVLPDDAPKLRAALPGSNPISEPEYAGMVEYAVKNGRLAALGRNDHDLNNNPTPHWFVPGASSLPAAIVGPMWDCAERGWSSDMDGEHEYTRTWSFRLNADKSVSPAFAPSYNQSKQDRFYLLSGASVYFCYADQDGVFRDVGCSSQEFTSVTTTELRGPYGLVCRPR